MVYKKGIEICLVKLHSELTKRLTAVDDQNLYTLLRFSRKVDHILQLYCQHIKLQEKRGDKSR